MVLVMESDGSLTPSRSQNSFARNYNDGIGQGAAADELAILSETDAEPEDIQVAAIARPAPLPRADVLAAIEATEPRRICRRLVCLSYAAMEPKSRSALGSFGQKPPDDLAKFTCVLPDPKGLGCILFDAEPTHEVKALIQSSSFLAITGARV